MSFILCLVAYLAFVDHVMAKTPRWTCRPSEINICQQKCPENYIGCFKREPFDCEFICEYKEAVTLPQPTPDGEFCYVDDRPGYCKNGECSPTWGCETDEDPDLK